LFPYTTLFRSESDRIFWIDADRISWRLYFPSQTTDFVPFSSSGPDNLRGLSSSQIQAKYGLAFGGQVAPPDASKWPDSNAVASRVEQRALIPTAAEVAFAKSPSSELYPSASKHIVNVPEQTARSGWRVESREIKRPTFVFVKNTSPKLIVHPLLRKLEIHPDDVRYGYRLAGIVVDSVDKHITQMQFIQDFPDLNADSLGNISLNVQFPDPAGRYTSMTLSLKVTDQAVRRGRNLSYFEQSKYCGNCDFRGEMLREIRALVPEVDK